VAIKAPRESGVVAACLQYLAARQIFAFRNNTGAACFDKRFVRFGTPGAADILAVLPPTGRLLAVECKRPGGRLTPAQCAFIDHPRAAGGLALVVRDVCDLQRALELEAVTERPGRP
jgi:hypothetical protein